MSAELEIVAVASVQTNELGPIWVGVSGQGLVAISIGGSEARFRHEIAQATGLDTQRHEERTQAVRAQIAAYLAGERQTFDIPIDWRFMPDFQAQVLRLALAIPRGETRTYGDLAIILGDIGSARAVGRALATNPMPLVLPCHRVIGADGKLHGFSAPGGVKTKAWLLALEGRPIQQQFVFDWDAD